MPARMHRSALVLLRGSCVVLNTGCCVRLSSTGTAVDREDLAGLNVLAYAAAQTARELLERVRSALFHFGRPGYCLHGSGSLLSSHQYQFVSLVPLSGS